MDENEHEDADKGIEDLVEVNESESTLLVNSTSANNINPGDIIKLMSAPEKGKPSPKISQKFAFKSEVSINGKAYREVR